MEARKLLRRKTRGVMAIAERRERRQVKTAPTVILIGVLENQVCVVKIVKREKKDFRTVTKSKRE